MTHTTDRFIPVKPFLMLKAPAVLAALIAFTAIAAQAATFNTPTPSSIYFDDNNCPSNGSMTGSATSGGAGLTLSGSGTMQGFGSTGYVCQMTMTWQGTGSGTLSGTSATITPNFSMTIPADVVVTCTLTVLVNGIQETQFNCAQTSPGGTFVLPAQSFPLPATLSTYSVVLAVGAQWTDTATTTFSLTIPPDASIDVLLSGSAPPATPAPSSWILGVTGIALLGAAFAMLRRKSADGGSPASGV